MRLPILTREHKTTEGHRQGSKLDP